MFPSQNRFSLLRTPPVALKQHRASGHRIHRPSPPPQHTFSPCFRHVPDIHRGVFLLGTPPVPVSGFQRVPTVRGAVFSSVRRSLLSFLRHSQITTNAFRAISAEKSEIPTASSRRGASPRTLSDACCPPSAHPSHLPFFLFSAWEVGGIPARIRTPSSLDL